MHDQNPLKDLINKHAIKLDLLALGKGVGTNRKIVLIMKKGIAHVAYLDSLQQKH